MGKKESDFQRELVKEIESRFEGAIVLKNDPNYIQGIPDLTILYKDNWAFLECKRNSKAHKQSNQEDYIRIANEMSFGRFICPENKEEVLNELQQAFQSDGASCPV